MCRINFVNSKHKHSSTTSRNIYSAADNIRTSFKILSTVKEDVKGRRVLCYRKQNEYVLIKRP